MECQVKDQKDKNGVIFLSGRKKQEHESRDQDDILHEDEAVGTRSCVAEISQDLEKPFMIDPGSAINGERKNIRGGDDPLLEDRLACFQV